MNRVSPRNGRPAYTVLTAPKQVASTIRREILEGVLKPGDKLPSEQEMAELFGVSRPTVRAGLQELCAARVLDVKRGRNGGYHVGDFSLDSLETSVSEFISLSLVVDTLKPEQFLEVRFAQELLCAETAAHRRSTKSLIRLNDIAAMIEQASAVPRRAFELDLEFHRALAEATENPLILSFEGAMIAVLHQLVGDGGAVAPADALGNIPEIIDAVRDGDSEGARSAMREHLEHSVAHYGVRGAQKTAGAHR
jgi:GntR family transcriptional regulator, transcriptional repressor for pyruvate dehydrogenase complex